jgi:hypothetical protein
MSNTRAKFYLIKNAPSSLKEELKPLGVKAIRARIAEHHETVGECKRNGHRDTGRGVCANCETFLPSSDGEHWA